ncbi:MAG: aspartate--tRNA ligase [Oscillospiraceae bacterium]|nr:aspartate--tRNA ligase [Oscillospiraceae bacterium]MCL2278788.1 aspartate--tRNA ligase [Oscillospiraceae bacterium]
MNTPDFKRNIYCGEPRSADIGRTLTVCGWVQRNRDLGGLIFIDLRDRTGILQLAFDDNTSREIFSEAMTVRAEFVLKATGTLRERSSKNPDLPTGDVELEVTALNILSKAETPPFEIVENSDVNDALRLKYRYLDLRRPDMQRLFALRHKAAKVTRDYFDENGFYEIETPILTKSTPEGARDYLVPSRVHKGKFYALPQSPQQYKQLLMLAGFDKYLQIVKCFRDEDLRADRQPEFTQIDLEMSFVDMEDIIKINEGYMKRIFKDILDVEVKLPIARLTYREAIDRFGSDKPDLRFSLELSDISDIVKNCEFKVFAEPVANGGSVRMLYVPGGGSMPRKQIDSLVEFVKTYGAKGLAWTKLSEDGSVSSSYSKFLTDAENEQILKRAGAEAGCLVLIVADPKEDVVFASLGALRIECAKRLNMIPQGVYEFVWITEFPMFEYSEEEERYVAKHHPFTAPMDEDMHLLESDKANCRAKQYDLVLNGTELGSGSIRINTPEMQEQVFRAVGLTPEEANEKFSHLITAFKYGAPPHGGIAYGLDRLVAHLAGLGSIRDVIAFPKVQNASEVMTACPDEVDEKQLEELGIKVCDSEH